jgi:hypothetical protein
MPDVTDLARLDEEIAPLKARLDELGREYDRVVDAIHEGTLAAIDLAEVRARTGGALRRLPALLATLEEVLAVHNEVCDWAAATFPDSDEAWRRLRAQSGTEDLDDALGIVADRINAVIARTSHAGNSEQARDEIEAIITGQASR